MDKCFLCKQGDVIASPGTQLKSQEWWLGSKTVLLGGTERVEMSGSVDFGG